MPIDVSRAPSGASPLWIIALFIALSEAMAGTAAIATDGTTRLIFAIFAVCFPVAVFATFVWLLIEHPANLYPPGEYTEQTPVTVYDQTLTKGGLALFANAVSEAALTAVTVHSDQEGLEDPRTLRDQVAHSFERAVEEGSVTIDRAQLIAGAEPVQIPIAEDALVDSFLDSVYFQIRPEVKAYTYGSAWLLVDAAGRPLDEMGTQWAKAHGNTRDQRPLSEIGILPGSSLSVVPIKSRSEGRRTAITGWQRSLGRIINALDSYVTQSGLTTERISGSQRPRLIAKDDSQIYGLYVMPGAFPKAHWVTLALEACQALAVERHHDVIPVLVIEKSPDESLVEAAAGAGLHLMWREGDTFRNAPWVRSSPARHTGSPVGPQ
jgi:hypothetical protein